MSVSYIGYKIRRSRKKSFICGLRGSIDLRVPKVKRLSERELLY